MTTTQKATKTTPNHKLYSVAKLKNGQQSWTEIGVAFPHQDGDGFDFTLTAIPARGGTFVMRRALSWKPSTGCWQLVTGDDCILGYIERDGQRWLCFTAEDFGNDGFLGQAATLAAAKAHLAKRFAAAVASEATLAAL